VKADIAIDSADAFNNLHLCRSQQQAPNQLHILDGTDIIQLLGRAGNINKIMRNGNERCYRWLTVRFLQLNPPASFADGLLCKWLSDSESSLYASRLHHIASGTHAIHLTHVAF
jgi:hypothetical protein